MSAREIASGPTDALRSLAEVQLQVQVTRLTTLDAQAIGVIAIDAATTAIVASASISGVLRAASLSLLTFSACLALRSNLLDDFERVGPSVARLLASLEIRPGDVTFDELLLKRLATDLQANEHTLARKISRLNGALVLVALASMLALVGSLY